MFGQGEMVYNKNILVYKGRIIMYQKGIKRLLAVVLSACGLLVLSPLLLLLCLAIKLDSPGPIFFRQKRVGIHKSYFNILGWAQIHGRDELEITEKAKLDGWYVEHMSFWLDVRCFFGTIRAVADHDGVVEGGTGTLHEEEENDHK